MTIPLRPNHRKIWREFFIASGFFFLLLLSVYREPLWKGQVDASWHAAKPTPQTYFSLFDYLYQTLPPIFTRARMIHDGVFPSWSPESQGGSPLIAKMQNGAFGPFAIVFYLFPISWMPYLLMLVFSLQGYFAFLFTYIYARSLGLKPMAALFSSSIFIFFTLMRGRLLPWSGCSGLYLPLLLLLVELYWQQFRTLVRFLLPWASALPFLAGHFESSCYVNLVATIYFWLRMREHRELKGVQSLARLTEFIGLQAVGVLISGIQIIPAVEYVSLSYNKIWHNTRWFDIWDYQTISKRLGSQDLPFAVAGIASFGFFAAAFRDCLRGARNKLLPAAALLALGVACLGNLGLDHSLAYFDYGGVGTEGSRMLCVFLLVAAFWGWSRAHHPGLKALGIILIGSLVLILKTPPFTNILIHVPPFDGFHNASAPRWEFQLSIAMLSTLAFSEICGLFPYRRSDRVKLAFGTLGIIGVFVFGFLGGEFLEDRLARLIPTALHALPHQAPSARGGIMGPHNKKVTYRTAQGITGWVSPFPPVSELLVGLLRDGELVTAKPATLDHSSSARRLYFHASFDLSAQSGLRTVIAQVRRSDGSTELLPGTQFEVAARPPRDLWILLATLLAFPALLLLPPLPLRLAQGLVFVAAVQFKYDAAPADRIPYKLTGISRIQQDTGLFRVASFKDSLLMADYPNVYGLADLRTGGDFLDVLTMIYFRHLWGSFAADAEDSARLDLALRLLGLANVKYLMEPSDSRLSHPALEVYSRSEDMLVLKNKHFRPRAFFSSRYLYLPLGPWKDWDNRKNFMVPITEALARKTLDVGETLLLHDSPSMPSSDLPGRSTVRIEQYRPNRVQVSVESDRAGLLFLSDNFFPGWRALVNERKADILRSWITFRAVEVPAGKSTVVFLYRSIGLYIGIWLTVGIALIWFLSYSRYRRQRQALWDLAPLLQDKKKQGRPPIEPTIEEETVACAVAAEYSILALVCPSLLFWLAWSAFCYGGGIQVGWGSGEWHLVSIAASLLMAGLLFFLCRGLLRRPAQTPGS